ncbi:MAG: HTH-type transcriptional regulator/antitoxin HipB [Lentimonas sp.]|jgi:HTH-type transcriptional regulator/antitoxin HipB
MSDLKKYIAKRKSDSPDFAEGYSNFRIRLMLKQARLEAGLTQSQVAQAIGTQKTAISRLENHVEEVKLSTVENVLIQSLMGVGRASRRERFCVGWYSTITFRFTH